MHYLHSNKLSLCNSQLQSLVHATTAGHHTNLDKWYKQRKITTLINTAATGNVFFGSVSAGVLVRTFGLKQPSSPKSPQATMMKGTPSASQTACWQCPPSRIWHETALHVSWAAFRSSLPNKKIIGILWDCTNPRLCHILLALVQLTQNCLHFCTVNRPGTCLAMRRSSVGL